MNAFTALLRREWLEHRTPYLAAAFGLMLLVLGAGALGALVATMQDGGVVTVIERIDVDGNVERHERYSDRLAGFADFSGWTDRELSSRLATIRQAVASLFHVIWFGVVLFVLLGCLYDERRDRSILFWKSMPAADTWTIASKLIMPVWIAPLLAVIAIGISWLALLLLLSAISYAEELGSISRLWAHSGIFSGILQEFVGYLVQGLWALPVYGWLMLVSSLAGSMPLLWAVAIPVVSVICERLIFGSDIVLAFLQRHLEFAALPRLSNGNPQIREVQNVADQLSLLLSPDLWLGIVIGLALLAAAIWCYGRSNEL